MEYAIEVRDLRKSFHVPDRRVETLKERLATRTLKPRMSVMPALSSVSFNVEPGEFFGVVGRNGSGKSTLLKVLAGIYRADAGTIRTRGRVAPIIELGVGFNQELTASENVVVNGVVMGLTEAEARKRVFQVIEFAGLSNFMGLKLKNFSSGMKVRLAFATMLHIDADVMLIDEILAVGDGAFKAQSKAALRELHAAGRTIILVTHSMEAMTQDCGRAMVLEAGRVDTIGAPQKVAERYDELLQERGSVVRARPARDPVQRAYERESEATETRHPSTTTALK